MVQLTAREHQRHGGRRDHRRALLGGALTQYACWSGPDKGRGSASGAGALVLGLLLVGVFVAVERFAADR